MAKRRNVWIHCINNRFNQKPIVKTAHIQWRLFLYSAVPPFNTCSAVGCPPITSENWSALLHKSAVWTLYRRLDCSCISNLRYSVLWNVTLIWVLLQACTAVTCDMYWIFHLHECSVLTQVKCRSKNQIVS
jgi:hypothetical protein